MVALAIYPIQLVVVIGGVVVVVVVVVVIAKRFNDKLRCLVWVIKYVGVK